MKRATLNSLLTKGYFPRELPPPFVTAAYSRFARNVGPSLPTGTWTRCVWHNLGRPGGQRRPLKIPNPISFYALASAISQNWTTLKKHTWQQRLSASRPHVMRGNSRAVVPRYRYGELWRLRAFRRRAGQYLLLTDIDQFYPTVYTHTIPWALHTKSACKAALKGGKGKKEQVLIGDVIDKALQAMNEGQTLGIPIGPDTSLVVAEILLAAVDRALVASKGRGFCGFRYFDNYELTFHSLSAAEETLAELQRVLASFELNLNPKKTRIAELPLDKPWWQDLKSIKIRTKNHPVGQRNNVLGLFSRAYDLAAAHPAAPVLRYAMARVQRLDVDSTEWRCFHNCVLGAAGADSSTLPVALGTLHEVSRLGGHVVPKGPLGEVFENVVARHAPRAQGSEVAWAIFGALAWSVPLSPGAARAISQMQDDVVAILALHAESEGLFPSGSLDTSSWATLVSQPDVLHGEHSLLAYEANQQGWLPTRSVAKNATFSAMSHAGVSFYNRAKAKPQFPIAGRWG